jgi:hypothetical protein
MKEYVADMWATFSSFQYLPIASSLNDYHERAKCEVWARASDVVTNV